MAGDINLSKNAEARLKNRTDRAYERIDKREDEKDRAQAKEDKKKKLERRAQWWQGVRDNLKEQGQEFLNYWTYDPDAEQKEEEKSSTNTGASATNTTTDNLNGNHFGLNVPSRFEMATPKDQREAYSELGLFPSGGVTTSNGATTSGGITSHQQAAQEAMRKNAKSYADYAKRVAGGASAYGELLREAIQQKNNIAFRKERTARAQAIANALGTLVNTITAGAIAKKNGTIPIIAGHDATADTNLRKSIEDRYAMENESENLLMQLVNSRIAHEKELAKAQLDADLKTNELGYKATSEDLKAAERKEKQEWEENKFGKQYEQNERKIKALGKRGGNTYFTIKQEKPYTKQDVLAQVGSGRYQEDKYTRETKEVPLGGTLESSVGMAYSDWTNAGFSNNQISAAIKVLNEAWVKNGTITEDDKTKAFNAGQKAKK